MRKRGSGWRGAVVLGLVVAVTPLVSDAQSPEPGSVASVRGEANAPEQALPELSDVLERLDRLYMASSSRGRLKMTVVNERGSRELEIEQWSRGRDEALMVIRSPAREAGTATLRSEEGLWNYAPRADRLIRVPTGMLSEAWMGSHFSNDDLMRETSLERDYHAALRWAELDGERVVQVELRPREGAPVVWEKVLYEVSAEDGLPHRARFYSGGAVERTMNFSGVRELGGRRLPAVVTVLPAKPGEYTRMEYVEMAFDVPVEASTFTRQGLRRVARTR
ncbi:outer membrane lipoprotein-sorting protein [Lujinxingia sediminis]|uniref:Outer membrane lipoprotein-sorting protein n=1 Tax=Lujinxingia sediminis TaxID=2480984 RepID=A0ABY0CUK7_9DELT|nr:outer membrane lipoprotein-sorting protein [Lujinxingia sediminis]RVU44829.1 outer membrane lipoprotein-sorting protein [Lujinxingia sediminis]